MTYFPRISPIYSPLPVYPAHFRHLPIISHGTFSGHSQAMSLSLTNSQIFQEKFTSTTSFRVPRPPRDLPETKISENV